MQFIRYFCLNFRFTPIEGYSFNFTNQLNGYELTDYGASEYKDGMLWVWSLHKSMDDKEYQLIDNKIELHDSIVTETNICIRFLRSYFSVLTQIEIEATSLLKTFAFVPECQNDCAVLENCLGLKTRKKMLYGEKITFETIDSELNLLIDRTEGVESLSEALMSGTSLARYREYVRFFELGFGRAGRSLYKPLLRFLRDGPVEYKKGEVSNWFSYLRSSAIHGDKKEPITSIEILQYTNRMKLAAYDVLFNKKVWNNSDVERRLGVRFNSGPGFITKGKSAEFETVLFDDLGDLPVNIVVTMPNVDKDLWQKTCE